MYLTQAAPRDLSPWVECVWSMRVPKEVHWDEVTPADLHGDLVTSLGQPFDVGSSRVKAASCWLGPRHAPLRFRHSSGNHLFGVRFQPGGAAAFFGVDARTLLGFEADGATAGPWRELLDAMTRQVDAGLRQHQGIGRIWHALRAVGPKRGANDRRLLTALEQHASSFRVATFAKQLGLSERTLQRRCLSSFGVRPKLLHRIQRAQAAQGLLSEGRPGAEVAWQLGFADQAHLCHELRALHGRTPASSRWLPLVCRLSTSPR